MRVAERLQQGITLSMYRLAINLFDLDRLDRETRQRMLSGVLGSDPIKVPGGAAVELTCELRHAAMICDVLRSNDRQSNDAPTKIYVSEDGGPWRQLPTDAVLTIAHQGKVELSARWFPTLVQMAPAVPLQPKRFC